MLVYNTFLHLCTIYLLTYRYFTAIKMFILFRILQNIMGIFDNILNRVIYLILKINAICIKYRQTLIIRGINSKTPLYHPICPTTKLVINLKVMPVEDTHTDFQGVTRTSDTILYGSSSTGVHVLHQEH